MDFEHFVFTIRMHSELTSSQAISSLTLCSKLKSEWNQLHFAQPLLAEADVSRHIRQCWAVEHSQLFLTVWPRKAYIMAS